MRKRLLDRFLERGVRRGTLEVVRPDGSMTSFGKAEAGYPDVRIRFTDCAGERRILLDPRLGAGEAFMDGQLVIEHGDVMDLLGLIRANSPWDHGGKIETPGRFKRLQRRIAHSLESVNHARKSQTNVAHHYDIGNDLYRLFLDAEHMQYSCAYWAGTRRAKA